MALRPRQGEVRVHDPARDASRLLPLRAVEQPEGRPQRGGDEGGQEDRPRVLLVGAGHAHALVLRQWADEGPVAVRLTVVTDRSSLVYSGMIPGMVAEEYAPADAVVDAVALARRAGARCVMETVVEIDADGRRVRLADGSFLAYDIASLDVGSTVRGLDGAGAPRGTVPGRDVDAMSARLRRLEAAPRPPSAVVVGGGPAGVELAAALQARFGRRFPFDAGGREGDPLEGASVTLVEGAARIMDGHPERVSRRVRDALESRGIRVRTGSPVQSVEGMDPTGPSGDAGSAAPTEAEASAALDAVSHADAVTVVLSSGERLPSDLTVWATGAASPPLLRSSGLPTDAEGFVLVGADLRVRGRDTLFAAGDCASLEGHELPKAGVHAVRQAPVLFDNLQAVVDDAMRPRAGGLRTYEPQEDSLTLLNLGDGTALGTKWGLVAEGRWVRWIKHAIDRRFVERLRD